MQEADESDLWLELLRDDCGISSMIAALQNLLVETNELIAIFVTMCKRTKSQRFSFRFQLSAFQLSAFQNVLRNRIYYGVKPFVPQGLRMAVRRSLAVRRRRESQTSGPSCRGLNTPRRAGPVGPAARSSRSC